MVNRVYRGRGRIIRPSRPLNNGLHFICILSCAGDQNSRIIDSLKHRSCRSVTSPVAYPYTCTDCSSSKTTKTRNSIECSPKSLTSSLCLVPYRKKSKEFTKHKPVVTSQNTLSSNIFKNCINLVFNFFRRKVGANQVNKSISSSNPLFCIDNS